MKRNPGWFRRGYDPRRCYFTRAELRINGAKGFRAALAKHPYIGPFLQRKVRAHAQRSKRGS